jgi:hypothetical protein
MNETVSMKIQQNLLIIFSIAILISGCRKNNVIKERQHILFQYDYVNYAWGYIHEGFVIDDEGNIMTYQNPESWNFHDPDYNLTENQLAENISRCTKSEQKIGKEELVKFSSYIDNIKSSKVTAKKNESADAGTSVFICYDFIEEKGIYKGYLIKMEGDYSCENLNFYSKKVSLWLKEINNSLLKR